MIPLLADPEPRIRANVARVLGDNEYQRSYEALVRLTSDADAHTRAIGTIALSKLGRKESVPAVLALLRDNDNKDPHIRSAAVTALIGARDMDAILAAATDPSAGVRMGIVIALRRMGHDALAGFLSDSDPRIALEAVRAVNDVPVSGAMKELAALIDKPASNNDAYLRRVINANYRYGTKDTAKALAKYAAKNDATENGRADALDALDVWPKSPGRDRVSGMWRPTAFVRDAKIPGEALRPVLDAILSSAPGKVRAAAARAAGDLGISEAAPALAKLVIGGESSISARVEALKALAALKAPELKDALAAAAKDSEEKVRNTATSLGAAGGNGAIAQLEGVISKGTLAEKQNAFATLGGVKGTEADDALETWMKSLIAGKVEPNLQLDILDAASARPALKDLVAKYQSGLDEEKDDIAKWRVCLEGGHADEGKKIFLEKAEVSCVRCHKVNGEGGEVGPELTGIITRHDRAYIVRSIVHPNAEIAQGFDNVLVSLKTGASYAGVVKSETTDQLVLNSPEDGVVTIKKSDITSREKGLSAMPEGFGDVLTKQELRNLVEFIATAK